ncbi:MAG: diaminopimelate decarboxylase [Bacteroidales bacterium]|nr:diaminopimelate decarboxylase [Bacteroidales bacterium]
MFDVNRIEFFEQVETPFYFYDMDLLRSTVEKVAALSAEYGITVHYAVKANVERRILEYISSMGFGADCVSGNEVMHACSCRFPAEKIVFAGVGKSDREIAEAIKAGVGMFNCESLQEIFVVNAMAGRFGKRVNVSIRVNPGVDAHTHRYITTGTYENKFGISDHEFSAAVEMIKRCGNIDFAGLHFHIGSQITDVEEVFALECARANEIVDWFEGQGLKVDNVNLGGGLGVDYEDPDGNPVADFATWFRVVSGGIHRREGRKIHIEPGRSMVAQCASLISRVLFVKTGETKNFLILDAGMNDLIRPALYGAFHKIENISAILRPNLPQSQVYDVVGPVCESSDVWGAGRLLPLSVRGDLMAIRSTGAYGQVMSSRYNLRDFAPAVYSDDMHGAHLRTEYFDNLNN